MMMMDLLRISIRVSDSMSRVKVRVRVESYCVVTILRFSSVIDLSWVAVAVTVFVIDRSQ